MHRDDNINDLNSFKSSFSAVNTNLYDEILFNQPINLQSLQKLTVIEQLSSTAMYKIVLSENLDFVKIIITSFDKVYTLLYEDWMTKYEQNIEFTLWNLGGFRALNLFFNSVHSATSLENPTINHHKYRRAFGMKFMPPIEYLIDLKGLGADINDLLLTFCFDVEKVKACLLLGANVNASDDHNRTPLYLVLYHARSSYCMAYDLRFRPHDCRVVCAKYLEAGNYLLCHGADMRSAHFYFDRYVTTPFKIITTHRGFSQAQKDELFCSWRWGRRRLLIFSLVEAKVFKTGLKNSPTCYHRVDSILSRKQSFQSSLSVNTEENCEIRLQKSMGGDREMKQDDGERKSDKIKTQYQGEGEGEGEGRNGQDINIDEHPFPFPFPFRVNHHVETVFSNPHYLSQILRHI